MRRGQSMFKINRSSSDVQKSPRIQRDIDSKTMNMISKSKSAITNMLESKAPKISFGGNKKPSPEPEKLPKITKPPKINWKYKNIINKSS